MSDQKIHTHGFLKIKPGEWQKVSCVIEDTQGDLIDEVGLVIEGTPPPPSRRWASSIWTSSGLRQGGLHHRHSQAAQGAGHRHPLRRRPRRLGAGGRPAGADVLRGEPSLYRQLLQPGYPPLRQCRAGQRGWRRSSAPGQGSQAVLYGRLPERPGLHLASGLWHEKAGRSPFSPEYGRTYSVVFQAQGDTLSLEIDGKAVLRAEDSTLSSGMVGLGALSMGPRLLRRPPCDGAVKPPNSGAYFIKRRHPGKISGMSPFVLFYEK